MLTRYFYIKNKGRYSKKEEEELIEFVRRNDEKCDREKKEWGTDTSWIKSLNKRVLAVYELRKEGGCYK